METIITFKTQNIFKKSFVDCLAGLQSVVADNVIVSVTPETSEIFPKLEITKAYGIT